MLLTRVESERLKHISYNLVIKHGDRDGLFVDFVKKITLNTFTIFLQVS